MENLWKAFRHGDWPFGNSLRPKQRTVIQKTQSGGETVLCVPQEDGEVSLNHSGQTIWELCDGRHTVGEIFLALRHGENRPEHELLADLTKNLLQLHKLGAVEFLGMEEPLSEETRNLDLRELPFYVINCPGDDKKREFIQRQLLGKELTFQFIDGIKRSPSYVGIAHSHLKILQSTEIAVPFAIIEDDCQFMNSFHYQFEVPSTTDALYLGVSHFGTKNPGEFSWGVWGNMQFRQYNDGHLRVFNMLGRHAIVYLSDRFRQSAI
jgi:hypothetical protein